jgi:hypothetical protein
VRPDDDNATVATANLDTHADDVLRLIDRTHITSVTLADHSYGGMVIAAVAGSHDWRIPTPPPHARPPPGRLTRPYPQAGPPGPLTIRPAPEE